MAVKSKPDNPPPGKTDEEPEKKRARTEGEWQGQAGDGAPWGAWAVLQGDSNHDQQAMHEVQRAVQASLQAAMGQIMQTQSLTQQVATERSKKEQYEREIEALKRRLEEDADRATTEKAHYESTIETLKNYHKCQVERAMSLERGVEFWKNKFFDEVQLGNKRNKRRSFQQRLLGPIPELPVNAGEAGNIYKTTYGGVEVAVKVLDVKDGADQLNADDEVDIASCMSHPHVQPLIGAYKRKGGTQAVLVTEWAQGGDLEAALLAEDPCLDSLEAVVRVATGAAEGVAHVHNMGIIHRDIKEANLFLTRPKCLESVVVGDFGCAIWAEGGVAHDCPGTGTEGYQAPETLSDGLYSEKGDMWSYGVVLAHLGEKFVPVAREECNRGQGLYMDLVDKCLTVDVAERPGSFRNIVRMLNEVAQAIREG